MIVKKRVLEVRITVVVFGTLNNLVLFIFSRNRVDYIELDLFSRKSFYEYVDF